jgi:hypothetical protein
MKVFGIMFVVKMFFAFKTNQYKGFVEAVLVLIIGFVFSGIAFLLGWILGKEATGSYQAVSTAPPPPANLPETTKKLPGLLLNIGWFALGLVLLANSGLLGTFKRMVTANQPVEDVVTAQARELSKGLPRMVTDNSRWDSVIADPRGNVLIYTYTFVGFPPELQIEEGSQDRFRRLIVASDCSDRDRNPLSKNITLRSRYLQEDGSLVADIIVSPADCTSLGVSNEPRL